MLFLRGSNDEVDFSWCHRGSLGVTNTQIWLVITVKLVTSLGEDRLTVFFNVL